MARMAKRELCSQCRSSLATARCAADWSRPAGPNTKKRVLATCDVPLCGKCAIDVGHGKVLCKFCRNIGRKAV